MTIPVLLEGSGKKQISDSYDWDLGSLQPGLSEGNQVEYWLEASDQNISGANVSSREINSKSCNT